MKNEPKFHNHKYIQKADEYDQLRWHQCLICKASEDCDCSEEEFEKRLKEDLEYRMDILSNNIIDIILDNPKKYLVTKGKRE